MPVASKVRVTVGFEGAGGIGACNDTLAAGFEEIAADALNGCLMRSHWVGTVTGTLVDGKGNVRTCAGSQIDEFTNDGPVVPLLLARDAITVSIGDASSRSVMGFCLVLTGAIGRKLRFGCFSLRRKKVKHLQDGVNEGWLGQ